MFLNYTKETQKIKYINTCRLEKKKGCKALLKNTDTQHSFVAQSKNDILNNSISSLAHQKGPFGHFF